MMAPKYHICLKIQLEEKPDWLSHIELTRTGDHVEIDVVKTNETSAGHAEMTTVEFNDMVDILLTVKE